MDVEAPDKPLLSLAEGIEEAVPRLRYDPASSTAIPAPPADEDEDRATRLFRSRYMAAVRAATNGLHDGVHVAVSPEPVQGRAGRAVYPVYEFTQVAEAVGRLSQRQPQYLDHVVLVDAAFAIGASADEVAAIAAGDVGEMIESLYPLDAEGPIAPVVPALVAMAATLLISYGSDGADVERVTLRANERLRRSLTHVKSDATRVGGDHPALKAMADALAREALAASPGLARPAEIADLVQATHGCMARALEGLGCRVVPAEPD